MLIRLVLLLLVLCGPMRVDATEPTPNVILIMMDDLGWGDAGYQGHPTLRTPHLDAIAASGIRFNRFYAAAPVCSPTRGSCLTGRHPARYGITNANTGHMPYQETTLAEILRAHGYRTGHFGKWHLGTLTRITPDSNRGGSAGIAHYAPPWDHGFDVCFSTEAKVPTFNPMITPARIAGGTGRKTPGELYGTAYWSGPERAVKNGLDGDNSRIIMDRAVRFIENAAKRDMPFLSVIWLHTPHLPIVAGDEHRALYPDATEVEKRYYGCITAADEQIGRLRSRLRDLGIADHTMLWFCSDNGPEGRADDAPGSAGPLRGRKRSLYEGGVRVPGLLEWPGMIAAPRTIDAPCSTSDYLPTILDAVGLAPDVAVAPLDGISLLPLILGRRDTRGRGIGFQSGNQATWVEDRFKLVRIRANTAEPHAGHDALFDLHNDLAEQHDISDAHPEVAARMRAELDAWRASCARSATGADYTGQPPRVLLLGDSISMGYHKTVVDALSDVALVVRPAENCAGTTKGVQNLDAWLSIARDEFEVIHFNFGLHDLKRVKVAGGNANSNDPAAPRQADVVAYERNLREIVDRLQQTGATLIFATTTPVPAGGVRPHRDPDDVARYNAVARRVMKEHGIAINDLHGIALARIETIQRPVDVHFTAEGSQLLGTHVARVIRDALHERADKPGGP